MSGSEWHLDYKHVLTFTILDAVTFCKRKYACIHRTDMNCLAALLLILVTLVGTLSAENVDGAGSRETWVPLKFFVAAAHTWQREAPSCAICRASLSVDTPMIPNFSVDNAIEKHVQALRANETKGWENDGSKFTEWQARKA